jgi:hypothetical protein
MKKVLNSCLFAVSMFLGFTLHAQSSYWTPVMEGTFPVLGVRQIQPNVYQTLHLDLSEIGAKLGQAPLEFTPQAGNTVSVELPMPNGDIQHFDIFESPIMEPGLASQFPEIKTFAGQGVEDPAATVRMDITPKGFHAFVHTPNGDFYIDPYSSGTTTEYISYFGKDLTVAGKVFSCSFSDANALPNDANNLNIGNEVPAGSTIKNNTNNTASKQLGDCTLRTYRLALAATGEYTTFHGGTVAGALAAQVTTMNRVNGVFETDFAVRMIIIANNSLLIYTNPATDPYTNNNGGTMLGENQTNCDAVIGNGNYDIGHVFSTGGGGVAGLGVVCNNSLKAWGVTGSSAPIGDAFDIDYVAHEIGHQFAGNHSFNNSCGGNRNNGTAVEPGSGLTIMGYAGICPPDIQSNSDAFFHGINIAETKTFLSGNGNSCSTKPAYTNSAPTVTSFTASQVIPKGTPFVLTASATDPNGNTLTYCWEQMDNQISTQPPVATSTGGPNFRSFYPTVAGARYFPRLVDLVANISPVWEVLPTVGRSLNFRLVVRDNNAGGGCNDHKDITLTVDGTSGPLLVTIPTATGISWAGGSTQTVTWNVANTNIAPVSCATVDILLSTDGGLTYPTTLATAVTNNGSSSITVPNTATTTARIMVRGTGRAFFDISNNNFTITACVPPVITAPSITQPTCQTSGTIVVNATGSSTLEYSINNGSTWQSSATFSGLNPGSYNIAVRLQATPTCSATYASNPVVLNVPVGCCTPPVINAPTVTQPTCAVNTGSIVVNATGSGTLEYSVNNGTNWQTSATFPGLAANSYNIAVRLQATPSCVAFYASNPVVLAASSTPSSFNVTGGGTYCNGGSGVVVGLGGSQTGVNYQLKLGNTNIGATVPGTGSNISFGNQTGAGTYTVVATLVASGCTAAMTGSVTVAINPSPTAFSVTGGGGYCAGGIGIAVGLSGSIVGTNYQLQLNNTNIGAAVSGTGSAISFGNQTNAGSYTVVATIVATSCAATMTGAVTIVITVAPNQFTVTGGGAFCLGTDPGSSVGLSGSQTGVNYQLQRNNLNVGAVIAGTGNPINFGVQSVSGNYTVIASNASSGCSVSMTGTVNISAFNCSASISDPCVCLNNATTLTNGQFGEQIKVNAPSTQTWTVSAVTGLYSTLSPAPPLAPFAITVGTALTNLGGNMFTLDGRHIDALGYTVSVTNGLGTTLSIGNSCQYPNPSFTASLDGPFCLYSDIVPLTGNPGDANIVSAVFTVNGVPATQFDPGAGVGQYTIEYTVDGGLPKAANANDPGCVQKIATTVNVIATPSQLVCNDLVYLSLDVDCVSEVNPDDILEGTYGCFDDYLVELDETLPYGNGPWVPAVVGAGDVGKTYQVRVTHLVTGNKCWGNIKIEDNLEPEITCTNITLFCPITNYEPNYLKNTLGITTAFPTVTDCSNYTLTYIDTYKDLACGQGFNGVYDLSAYVIRKWTAKDAWGNESICTQFIYFKRLHVQDVLFPADFTVSCNTNSVNTDPSVTGVPYVKAFGINWGLFPDPGFCEMQCAYADQILPVCDGTYKILRTWTVVDWCLPTTPFPPSQNPQYYIQLIKVVDDKGPNLVCPANLTVSTDPYTCCGTIDLPDVVLTDNCSRINAIEAMVTTFDPFTNQQTGMYTVGGSLTSFPGNDLKYPDTLGNWGVTPCLPLGTHTVLYTASDDCGNTKTCTFKMKIEDLVPPVPVCQQSTKVAVGSDGNAVVLASTFDDGSYDNCGTVYIKVRRMSGGNFDDDVTFSCSDIGSTITVVLRAYDVSVGSGSVSSSTQENHANDCMVQVKVEDKIKPVCTAPANVTVSCEQFDPTLVLYGNAKPTDNCCLDNSKSFLGVKGLSNTVNYTLFDTVCNKGTIARNFQAYDCHGLSSSCTQRIVVTYEQDYFVKFPNDVIVSVCDGTGNYGAPSFFGEDCELLGVSFEDEIFTVVPDACFKIERTWSIINWCTYNPNLPCINVPNPNPNAITNAPANLPGVTVSPLGTATPWNPTVVKINPTDAQATNYSIFYDANANCYRYKQIIKVIDTQDPTVTAPTSPVEYCDLTPNDPQLWNNSYWWDNTISSHDLCEGDADLSITGTDACSGSNISFRYLLFLDLDGDNVMETVVSSTNLPGVNNVQFGNAANPNYTGGQPRAFDGRPVPFNQQYRFGLDWTTSGTSATAKVRFDNLQSPIALPGTGNNVMQGVVSQLPYGTHKIKWFVEDGCGNETISEYTFVVKDCKKPTVVCLNGLSVNIMPTQMIQLWASDFLQYTQDNCTPADQLKIAIRKSGDPTPGFPVDAQGNPITNVTFTCGELGTQLVKLWSIDKAGNADYCETYVIVQDNNANCPPSSGAAKVAGALATEAVNGVQDGNVEIAGSGNGIPSFTFTTMSNASGVYNFNAIPLATNSTVTPAKDDNPLNGVSTYDLVLISKHILGIESLNSPYKMIAADANKSGSITTFDIVELRKLILGIYSDLPNNTSWRFVDKSYVFPNVNNPFQATFAENKSILNLSTNMLDEDFVSVKVGDVNGNAIANAAMASDDRSSGTLLFDIMDRVVTAGETFTVSLTAAEAVAGYQFTMNFKGLEVVDITPGANMTMGNFGVFGDAITTSYDGPNQGAFSVTFRALQGGKLSELLSVSSRITKAEAYSTYVNDTAGPASAKATSGEKMNVAFRFNNGNTSTVSGVGFELYQNQPNPFVNKTMIGFHLPAEASAQAGTANASAQAGTANASAQAGDLIPVTLSIFDETGRLVYTQKGSFAKGYNSFAIDCALLNTVSVLYYKVETATDSATKKMIQTK